MATNNCTEIRSNDGYYVDILVLGRTGQGMSTLANQLLGIDPWNMTLLGVSPTKENSLATVIKPLGSKTGEKLHFETGDGNESATTACKVLSNEETKVRVMDTVGFSAAPNGENKGNVKCFQQVVRLQKAHDLQFSRVLYFLPNRGAPERAEGTLQEEIKVMHDCFDKQIFNVMVIIATNNKQDRYQAAGFDDGDVEAAKEVFQAGYKAATGMTLPKSPPVVYISVYEDHRQIFHNIMSSDIISNAKRLCYPTKIMTQYQCTYCTVRVVSEKPPFGSGKPVWVINENNVEENYDSSKCHPTFISQQSLCSKIMAWFGYAFTFGFLPEIGNSEKVCATCERPPGSGGCCSVNESVPVKGQLYMVNHCKCTP